MYILYTQAHNLIVSARPLIKMRCKYLKELLLEGNYIKELDCFYQMDFNKDLLILSLEK